MDLRYPTGKYEALPISEEERKNRLTKLTLLPSDIELAVSNLDAHQLATPYRENGWTIQQVVHHLADSHMNALVRFKNALTETDSIIKPYNEGQWALLPDVNEVPINISITLLHALHIRLVAVLRGVQGQTWHTRVVHPEHKEPWTLWYLFGLYAWHGHHHVAHITQLRKRMNW
jgi:hypothetical protein